jgi:hypothetical protein
MWADVILVLGTFQLAAFLVIRCGRLVSPPERNNRVATTEKGATIRLPPPPNLRSDLFVYQRSERLSWHRPGLRLLTNVGEARADIQPTVLLKQSEQVIRIGNFAGDDFFFSLLINYRECDLTNPASLE